jgi:hypothetical protein
MSRRELRTSAGALIESSIHCTLGRSSCLLGRRGLAGVVGWGTRARSNGCARSALVELQRAGERVEHGFQDAVQVAALQARVVRDADFGEDGDLLPA